MNLVPGRVLNPAETRDVIYGFRPEACAPGDEDGVPATVMPIRLGPDPARLAFFDAASGRALATPTADA